MAESERRRSHYNWTADELVSQFERLRQHFSALLDAPIPVDNSRGEEAVTARQLDALRVIEPGRTTMRKVATLLGISHGSATSISDRLVRAGLAERQFDDSDRRLVYLVITDDGRSVLEQARERQTRAIAAVSQRLDGRLVPVGDCAAELLELLADTAEELSADDSAAEAHSS